MSMQFLKNKIKKQLQRCNCPCVSPLISALCPCISPYNAFTKVSTAFTIFFPNLYMKPQNNWTLLLCLLSCMICGPSAILVPLLPGPTLLAFSVAQGVPLIPDIKLHFPGCRDLPTTHAWCLRPLPGFFPIYSVLLGGSGGSWCEVCGLFVRDVCSVEI